MATAASLAAASTKQPENSSGMTQTQLRDIVNVVSNVPHRLKQEQWKNRILWVDDRPENNVYERQAFEAQGIELSLALSTDAALELLKTNKFAVIISDMGRKEGSQEGLFYLRNFAQWAIKRLS